MANMSFPTTNFSWLQISDYDTFSYIVETRRRWQNFNSLVSQRFSSTDVNITEAMYHGSMAILALTAYETCLTAKDNRSFAPWLANPQNINTLAHLCYMRKALVESEGADSETLFDVFDIDVTIDIFLEIFEYAYMMKAMNHLDNIANFEHYCVEIEEKDDTTINLFLLEAETA